MAEAEENGGGGVDTAEENGGGGVDKNAEIQILILEARRRWLTVPEVRKLLPHFLLPQDFRLLQLTTEPPIEPESGKLYIFDKTAVTEFRNDRYQWENESYSKLKIGGEDVLTCDYATGSEDKTLKRRVYKMLNKEPQNIVLVHYLWSKAIYNSISWTEVFQSETEHVLIDSSGYADSSKNLYDKLEIEEGFNHSDFDTWIDGFGLQVLFEEPCQNSGVQERISGEENLQESGEKLMEK